MLGALLTFLIVGIVTLVVASVVLAVVGVVFSIAWVVAGFLLFKVAPILLVGYLVVRFLMPKHKRLSRTDQEWLES